MVIFLLYNLNYLSLFDTNFDIKVMRRRVYMRLTIGCSATGFTKKSLKQIA